MNKGPLVAILFLVIVAVVGIGAYLVATKYLGTSKTDSNTVVELNYLSLWDDSKIYEPLISEYETANPNVKILYSRESFINQPSVKDLTYKGVYQVNAEERLKSGAVDIVRVHQTWIPKLQQLIAQAPDDVITGAKAKEIYYPAIATASVDSNNKVLASPQSIDGLVLFYNKELFAQAGITDPASAVKDWDVTLVTAKKLTQKNTTGTIKVAGINMGSVSNIRSSPEILLTMLTQSNIKIVTYNTTSRTFSASFATPEGAAALSRYFEFSKQGVWSSRLGDDVEMFAEKKLAMLIAPSWRAIDLVNMNSNLRFDSLPLPILPGANTGVPQYLASYWTDVVSNKSKNPAEAWKFLNWLSQPEQLRRIYKAQTDLRIIGGPYPRMDMASEQKDAPYIGSIITMAPNMTSWPLFDYGIWEESFRSQLLEYEDAGGLAQDNLLRVQTEINKLTLKQTAK